MIFFSTQSKLHDCAPKTSPSKFSKIETCQILSCGILSAIYTVPWILNTDTLFFFSFDVVLYLGFEKWEDQIVLDESDKGNNAFLSNGAFIAPHRGACGNFASLGKIGDIILEDTTFRGKPRTAITVASWVNLPGTTRGSHSVFSTARVMRIGQVMGKHTFVPTYG